MNTSSIREEVVDNDNENFITTMDPMQCFSSEISIAIIQAALPSDGTYSACLLDLTNVSQKWQTLLLYTRVLWSQLYIDETQPDFLALLSLSIKLADKVPLKIVLCGCLVHDWTGLGNLLLPAYERVIGVVIMMTLKNFQSGSDDCDSALSAIFNHFGYPPKLKDLVVDNDMLTPSLMWSSLVNLPPTVRLVGNIGLTVPPISKEPRRLFDKVEYDIICLKQHHKNRLGHLRPLSLHYSQSFFPFTITTEAHLPVSKYLTNPLDECTSFEQLIYIVAFSLCSLTISIDPDFIGDLIDCLPELCSLQALALDIKYTGNIQPPKLNRTDVVVSALQYLRFEIGKDVPETVWDEDLAIKLFEMLMKLYPCIQKLSLDAPSWPYDKLSRFECLPALKDLEMKLRDKLPLCIETSINLPSVQALRLDNASSLGDLTAPNLLRLTLKGTDLAARFTINTQSLYYLVVCISKEQQNGLYLDPIVFPGIKKLRLERHGEVPQWRLGSFIYLVSIEIMTRVLFTNPLGDSLCLHFIYYPDSCPSLQEISSNRCFEWDLLFLMLQHRNFGRKGVKKIQTVTIPFVPFAFRKHFELLLAGKHSEGPSFISQTLEATREVMFDANVPGCRCCLRNQRPNCTEVIERDGANWPGDERYPRLEKPPATTTPEIRDSLLWHESLVDKWKKCYAACEFRRKEICGRWLSGYIWLAKTANGYPLAGIIY